MSEKPSWIERENLIVFHGSLYKLASYPFLSLLFELLLEDKHLEFVFMGRGDDKLLSKIFQWAKEKGVDSRVHYEGHFSPVRNNEGIIDDPGWEKLKGYLLKARLAPNPWPIGGGSARFEAYLSGAPMVHMGVRFDSEIWGKSQHTLVRASCLISGEWDCNFFEFL